MFWPAVRVGTRLKAWKMKPMCSRRNSVRALSFRPKSSVPPIRMEVAGFGSGVSRVAMVCISVDLPEPEGPIIAVNLPCSKSTETLLRAWTVASPMP